MTRCPPDTVVVGLGHAARSFHLPAIADLAAGGLASGRVTGVDPLLAAGLLDAPAGVVAVPELPPGDGDEVVHVCTSPDSHAEVVLAATARGYRRFVVEKPMATSRADAAALVELVDTGAAEIFVVTNWSVSAVTERLTAELLARAAVPVTAMHVVQSKPRIERTLRNHSHRSAFEVEMPHMVALVLSLVAGPVELVDADRADLVVDGVRRPGMASARMTLRTGDGLPITLVSDLTAPWRERSVTVEWADGSRVAGFFPCDSSDRYGHVFTWDGAGRQVGRWFLPDDTVRRFLRGTYAHFAGDAPRPVSDVRFGARITELICAAQEGGTSGDHRGESLFDTARVSRARA